MQDRAATSIRVRSPSTRFHVEPEASNTGTKTRSAQKGAAAIGPVGRADDPDRRGVEFWHQCGGFCDHPAEGGLWPCAKAETRKRTFPGRGAPTNPVIPSGFFCVRRCITSGSGRSMVLRPAPLLVGLLTAFGRLFFALIRDPCDAHHFLATAGIENLDAACAA